MKKDGAPSACSQLFGPIALLIACAHLTGCGADPPAGNLDQESYYAQWTNQNATDAQIDALLSRMPRPVANWQATVTNVIEKGEFTVVETEYRNQNYYLWTFEPDAREKARQIYAQTKVVFSGEIVQELSLTRTGARSNPEFGVYVSKLLAGGLEIVQSPEGIANQHKLDGQAAEDARAAAEIARRDSHIEENVVAHCKDIVTKQQKFPVGTTFSWFQSEAKKEAEGSWVYTDVVTSLASSGEKRSTRFVCSVKVDGDTMEAQVKILK